MNKQEYISKLESGEGLFPRNETEAEWFDEWLLSHPEVVEKADNAFKELNEEEAAKYMMIKIHARIFADNNAIGMCSCKVEKRKITIYGFNNDKLEIEF